MIIPRAKSVIYKDGCLKFESLHLFCDGDGASFAETYLSAFHKFGIEIVEKENGADFVMHKNIRLRGNEYKLTVDSKIYIEYCGAEGLRNALASLIQIIRQDSGAYFIKCQAVSDYSECEHRSVMIDLARGLPDFDRLKEDIKRISLAKCNYLHLHLMDSKGICYESNVYSGDDINGTKRYPISAMKEINSFCAMLGITVIPEIEIPAHAHYLLRTHPEFKCRCGIENQSTWCICAGNDAVFDFYKSLLEEIAQIFSGRYIHIGGDELCFNDYPQWNEFCHWDICDACKKRMTDNGLKDKYELYCYVMNRINEIVKSLGKTTIMWNDEIDVSKGTKLSKDIVIEYWRIANENRGPRKGCSFDALLKRGFRVINGNYHKSYIDAEEYANPEKTASYSYLDYPYSESSANIIGAEVLAWQYGNPENVFYKLSFAPCAILLLDKMWDCSDAVYNDEYRKSLSKLILGLQTPDDCDIFEIFGSVMPPRTNEKTTYATIGNELTDVETLGKYSSYLEQISDTYSPLYMEEYKKIIDLQRR